MGALTSKPYAFSARPWELESRDFFDYFDSTHSPIQVSVFGGQISRVIPFLRSYLRDEWISDRVRFGYDTFQAGFNIPFGLLDRHLQKMFNLSFFPAMNYFLSKIFLQGSFSTDIFSPFYGYFFSNSFSRLGLSSNDSSATLNFSTSPSSAERRLVFNISLRYTHPIYFSGFLAPKNSIQTFEAGTSSHLGSFSFGSGLTSSINFFRFRNRISSYFNTFSIITSGRIYKRVLSGFSYSADALSEAPFADTNNFSSSIFPSFNAVFDCFYPCREGFDFFFPQRHPYESPFFSYDFFGKVIWAEPVFKKNADYDFLSGFYPVSPFKYGNRVNYCSPVFATPIAISSFNSAYFSYDHFFGFALFRNSKNLLLSYNQLDDYQQPHFRSF